MSLDEAFSKLSHMRTEHGYRLYFEHLGRTKVRPSDQKYGDIGQLIISAFRRPQLSFHFHTLSFYQAHKIGSHRVTAFWDLVTLMYDEQPVYRLQWSIGTS